MQRFRNILVGVDLTQGASDGAPSLGPDNQEAVRRACWLASQNGARLLFFSALNMTDAAIHRVTTHHRSRHLQALHTVEDSVREALDELVQEATAAGVKHPDAKLVRGRGWLEITRQVLRGEHDLVVVGSRHLHGLRRILMGSTAMNLVRKCPCAVWVTKAGMELGPMKVLVATDLTPVAQDALRLALSLRELSGAELHVLHAVEYPLDLHWSTGLNDPATEEYHRQVRDEAMKTLNQHLSMALDGRLASGVGVHLADRVALPDAAILHFIEEHKIDLLVIGTLARGGIPGLFIGNTAERLLPEVPCSVLTVKPANFHCPVHPS